MTTTTDGSGPTTTSSAADEAAVEMALPTTSPAVAAAAPQNNRHLVNRPSNPIISMEEDDDTSNEYRHIRLSQQEGQLSDLANIVAAEYTNNNQQVTTSEKKSEIHVVDSTALDSLQLQQEQTAIKSVEFTAATLNKNTNVSTTAAAKSSNNNDSNSNSGDILTASLHRSKRGKGYLASQTDLTSISSEQFACGCTLLQLCAIGSLHDVITYIQCTPYDGNNGSGIINFRDYDRRTALHVASSEGHLSIVQYLVNHGAKINRSDRWGGSPLDDAHRHRHTDVARYLRGKGATTGSVNLMNNLISAAAAGDMEEVRMIVASSGSGGGGGGVMDLSGSRKKQDSQHGGGILSRKGSIGGIVDMVKTPLDLSGSRRLGGSSSGGGGTGGVNLDTSSSNVNQSALDINKGDYDHRTALHLAASEGHIDVVKFLCQHGANVNVQDRWGGRPLDDALSKGNEGVAKVLLEYGATSAHNDDEKGGSSGHSSQNHFRRSNKLSLTGSEVDTDGEDENLRVEFSELEMIERIGSGAFGEIYKCRWRGILVAAKCIKASKIQKEWLLKKQIQKHNRIEDRVEAIKQSQITDEEKELALEDFRKETAIMRRLRHPNIVMMLAYSHTDDVEVMISEICRCSLLDIFKANAINNSNLPKQTQIKYAQQLAAGMNHLHKSRPPIIHRDLKPANLLIDFSGTLKIADFGLAKIRPNPEQNEVEAFQMTGETGSYRFMAPEVFRHEEYSETVDVYSYAMIFYYMLRSIPPWSGLSGVDAATKAAVDGERPIIPRDVDERLSLLLKRCWDENPTARPSFEEIITSLSIYSHDVYKTDTDNPQWEAESKCMPGGCVIS
ncbi:hypothetical protein ACHAWC_010828 [Mediolabrus comicus]